jgi:integrase/recombinase XerD
MTQQIQDVARPGRARRCWPVTQWPEPDREAWAASLIPGDPFAPGGLAAQWAPTSRRAIETSYGGWLAWCQGEGILDPLLPPAARVSKERVKAYHKALQASKSPFTVVSRLQMLGDALRAMAPDGDWRWIGRAAGRLRSRAVSVRNKRERLQPPDRLADLGNRLMSEADAESLTLDNAMTFRDGLVIALLAHRPIRARNLAMIRCNQHLVNRNGSWWLFFAGNEMKAKRPLEFPLPLDLVPNIERYLAVYRPLLLTGGGQHAPAPLTALWISRDATVLGYSTIAHHVRRHTKAAFGAALNPHLFRDCAATFIAIVAPEHVQIIAAILGHSTLATSEKHYNLARTLEAGRSYHGTIEKRRDRTKPSDDQIERLSPE